MIAFECCAAHSETILTLMPASASVLSAWMALLLVLEQRLATAQQEADQERSIKEQCEKTMRHQEITINRLQTIILQKGAKPAATRHRKLLR